MSDLPAEPRIGSLCTGYGGLELAAELVLGGQLAWYAETGRCKRHQFRRYSAANSGPHLPGRSVSGERPGPPGSKPTAGYVSSAIRQARRCLGDVTGRQFGAVDGARGGPAPQRT